MLLFELNASSVRLQSRGESVYALIAFWGGATRPSVRRKAASYQSRAGATSQEVIHASLNTVNGEEPGAAQTRVPTK